MRLSTEILALVGMTLCYGPHHPRCPHHHYKPSSKGYGPKLTQDSNVLQDNVRIAKNLTEWIPEIDVDGINPEELFFYYFRVHDFDNNSKLDGLEILQAIGHIIDKTKERSITRKISYAEEELQHCTVITDRVLAENDLDGDGFITFTEYVLSRKKDKKNQWV